MFVPSINEKCSQAQLCHGAQRHEQEQEWVIARLQVRHFVFGLGGEISSCQYLGIAKKNKTRRVCRAARKADEVDYRSLLETIENEVRKAYILEESSLLSLSMQHSGDFGAQLHDRSTVHPNYCLP